MKNLIRGVLVAVLFAGAFVAGMAQSPPANAARPAASTSAPQRAEQPARRRTPYHFKKKPADAPAVPTKILRNERASFDWSFDTAYTNLLEHSGPYHVAVCNELFPRRAGKYCAEVLEPVQARLDAEQLMSMNAFLKGEISQEALSELTHKAFLKDQIRKEQLLDWEEMQGYMPVGEDPFLAVSAWFVYHEPGWMYGDEILARGLDGQPFDENAGSEPDPPLPGPEGYGKKGAVPEGAP